MKTIREGYEEARREIREKFIPDISGTDIEEIYFNEGVSFSQKWYSVDDELPEAIEGGNGYSTRVLVRSKNMYDEIVYSTAIYRHGDNKWFTQFPDKFNGKVLEWRYIELK